MSVASVSVSVRVRVRLTLSLLAVTLNRTITTAIAVSLTKIPTCLEALGLGLRSNAVPQHLPVLVRY